MTATVSAGESPQFPKFPLRRAITTREFLPFAGGPGLYHSESCRFSKTEQEFAIVLELAQSIGVLV